MTIIHKLYISMTISEYDQLSKWLDITDIMRIKNFIETYIKMLEDKDLIAKYQAILVKLNRIENEVIPF